MQAGNVVHVRTLKGTHFTGALVTNAGEFEDIVLPGAIGAGGHSRARVRAISILSDQALDWEVMLFGKDTGSGATDLDLNSFISKWAFLASEATQVAGTGMYYYYTFGNDQHYEDQDMTGELHILLVNRSATSKNAGATGEVVVDLVLEPTLGW